MPGDAGRHQSQRLPGRGCGRQAASLNPPHAFQRPCRPSLAMPTVQCSATKKRPVPFNSRACSAFKRHPTARSATALHPALLQLHQPPLLRAPTHRQHEGRPGAPGRPGLCWCVPLCLIASTAAVAQRSAAAGRQQLAITQPTRRRCLRRPLQPWPPLMSPSESLASTACARQQSLP